MKKFIMLALFSFSSLVSANNVIVNGTRFIYPANDKEITIQLNNSSTSPALVQSWLDEGDSSVSPDDVTTPFTITPPITTIEGNMGQSLRIRAIDRTGIAKDRESLWYLNILEIPPSAKSISGESGSVFQMAIRSRFKFIYRPEGLGDSATAYEKLSFKGNGKTLTIENPTPFYITIVSIAKKDNVSVNNDTLLISPRGKMTATLSAPVTRGEVLAVTTLNDYGSGVHNHLTIK